MDWGKVGSFLLKNGVKRIGGLLTNPVSEAADIVGDLISGKLGTGKDPDEIMEAVTKDPEALVKLKELEFEHRTELDRLWLTAGTERIKAVNETMRAEAQVGAKHKLSAIAASIWRPFWGVASAVAFMMQVWYIMHLISKVVTLVNDNNIAQVPIVINAVSTIIAALIPLWAVPGAILGVTAWHRGKMQRVQAGEENHKGVLSALAERIGK